nr:AAA family ATPase [uncultured Albidiferax sp.]
MAQAKASKSTRPDNRLAAITISGFKSIRTEKTLALSALNILAGANSAGKSSFMQPLLLLKQTLEATYDPGPLLINGPNVKFTELAQIFSKPGVRKPLQIGLTNAQGEVQKLVFDLDGKKELHTKEAAFIDATGQTHSVSATADSDDLVQVFGSLEVDAQSLFKYGELKVLRERPFLGAALVIAGKTVLSMAVGNGFGDWVARNVIHVPGLRGNPERSYPKTAVGNHYPGTLDLYVASIIAEWQDTNDERLAVLGNQLQRLGLTWKVTSKKLDDTRVELLVGRLPSAAKGGEKDLVSIADVGFGVSQVLPVLVALLIARPGQVVYIEQPETHLHPKAQRALAGIFAHAATKQATVVVETHSLIFVRAVQTLVAKQDLAKELVKLHWVERDAKGDTTVTTRELDNAGAYGDWPQDFEATEMAVEQDYIDAAEKVLFLHG